LAAKDYVKQNPVDLTYRLGWRLATMARAFDRETWLTENIRPHLQQLAREVSRSINLAVFQNNRVIPLDCMVPERSALPLYTWPGNTFPAHATALGKTLLAHLDVREAETVLSQLTLDEYTSTTITRLQDLKQELETIRRRGYSVNHGEFVPEERCVAAPIRDAGGTTVAAISITGRVSQMPPELEAEMGAAVVAAAQRISRALFGASQSQSDKSNDLSFAIKVRVGE
jgi:DNA-binding IclR family transcriptional regulator